MSKLRFRVTRRVPQGGKTTKKKKIGRGNRKQSKKEKSGR